MRLCFRFGASSALCALPTGSFLFEMNKNMKPTIRTFIAVDIAPDIKSMIRKAIKPFRTAYPDIRWVEDDQLHITLKFLGDVPTVEIHEVIETVQAAVREMEAFDLVLEGLGAFPDLDHPRTVWVGISEGLDELQELADRVERSLESLGFHREKRPFTPHVTLGRVKQSKPNRGSRKSDCAVRSVSLDDEFFKKETDRFFGSCPVDEVTVYASELFSDGPQYEMLGTGPLAALG